MDHLRWQHPLLLVRLTYAHFMVPVAIRGDQITHRGLFLRYRIMRFH